LSNESAITGRLRLPQDSAFGRILPKNKIYQHARPTAALKATFVEQVEKIIHTSILSHKTVNLPAKDGVKEIQVFTIILRTPTLKQDILQAIDKAIPYPTLFILSYNNKIRYVAAYKRPSEADRKKWVVSSHFASDWISEQSQPQNLPLALDLQSLYEQLMKRLIPMKSRDGQSMDELVLRAESLNVIEREAANLEKKVINKNLQFNRRVELNSQLKNLNTELKELKS
jgi:hypothetical protein